MYILLYRTPLVRLVDRTSFVVLTHANAETRMVVHGSSNGCLLEKRSQTDAKNNPG